MAARQWPDRWQPEAIKTVEPYVDSEYLLDIWVADPATSIGGTRMAGYVYKNADGRLEMIHDRSERKDVYPGPLLLGPVLRVTARLPSGRRSVVFEHPDWKSLRRA